MPPNQDSSSRLIKNGKIQPIWNVGMTEFAKVSSFASVFDNEFFTSLFLFLYKKT